MDDWDTFNETTLPEKEEFYNNLNMVGMTDTDYMHAKRVVSYTICILKVIHYL